MAMTGNINPPFRVPLVVLGFLSLFAGIGAGLARFGWSVPAADLAAVHGPLMVCGFFGTVISLERAVALGRRWAYAAPLACGIGALALLLHAPFTMAATLLFAGSAVMLLASINVYRRQRELFTLTLALGAAAWSIGNLLWLAGRPVYDVVTWWAAFFVLTIAGERLELSRLLPASPMAKRIFGVLVALLLAGTAIAAVARGPGTLLFGIALAGLALWLAKQDIARRTVKSRGLTRFIAVCLLSGYVWLAVGGVTILASQGLGFGGAAYDAALHALLLGFVFSMVFGHAAIILPAVLRVSVPYHPYFYAPLVLLHASLFVRLGGDALSLPGWRAWGGVLNALALVAFVLGTIIAVARGSRIFDTLACARRRIG